MIGAEASNHIYDGFRGCQRVLPVTDRAEDLSRILDVNTSAAILSAIKAIDDEYILTMRQEFSRDAFNCLARNERLLAVLNPDHSSQLYSRIFGFGEARNPSLPTFMIQRPASPRLGTVSRTPSGLAENFS